MLLILLALGLYLIQTMQKRWLRLSAKVLNVGSNSLQSGVNDYPAF